MPGKNITEERYLSDRHDTVEQLAENIAELKAHKKRLDKLQLEVFQQKWTSRLLVAVLLGIGGMLWKLIEVIKPFVVKMLESLPKK